MIREFMKYVLKKGLGKILSYEAAVAKTKKR